MGSSLIASCSRKYASCYVNVAVLPLQSALGLAPEDPMHRAAAALSATLAASLLALPAQGQQYPNKPIRIVVPFAPGGTSDILARAIGPHITTAWGQPVIVENRTGANGNVGADYVAKSPPDGTTLLLSDVGALSINPSVYTSVPFDPAKDFSPIVMVSYSPHVLAVHPSVPVGSVKELAVSSAQRVPSAPELPTVAETLPGFETGSYQGVLAAAGTPREIVTKLNAELTRILNTSDMKEFLAKQGTEVRAGAPEALGTFIVNEKGRWAKVVKEAGVKAD